VDGTREPGAGIGREIAAGERADLQIETFIARRDKQRRETEGDRAEEEAFMESERAYFARLAADGRAEWVRFHRAQAARHRAVLEALIQRHEAAAEANTQKEVLAWLSDPENYKPGRTSRVAKKAPGADKPTIVVVGGRQGAA